MARPRVFVSSTFYDLRHLRADLEHFIRDIGYDPILNERGNVTFGSTEELEEYCYKEIELADIIVSIIGGRYGTGSRHEPYSISQYELKTAVKLGKQVYIFVDKSVYGEFQTYLANKELKEFKPRFVDNIAVYHFLEEVEVLPAKNPIHPFETATEILTYLREQWAGLVHRVLREQVRQRESNLIDKLGTTAKTLDQLVNFLTEDRKASGRAIHSILMLNHPAFERMRKVTNTSYRIVFTNHDEMVTWLKARSYKPLDADQWDSPDYEEFIMSKGKGLLLQVHTDIFDAAGQLKLFSNQSWDDSWIRQRELDEGPEPADSTPW